MELEYRMAIPRQAEACLTPPPSLVGFLLARDGCTNAFAHFFDDERNKGADRERDERQSPIEIHQVSQQRGSRERRPAPRIMTFGRNTILAALGMRAIPRRVAAGLPRQAGFTFSQRILDRVKSHCRPEALLRR